MDAEKRLKEALYHLRNMEQTYATDEEHFIYELNCFLITLRSIPDVLLEDFNKKYGLGISLDEKLTPQVFERRAQELNKTDALCFIEWWKERVDSIVKDRYGSFLFHKRNISVHRRVVTPDSIQITLTETIHLTDSVSIKAYDESENLIREEEPSPPTTSVVENRPPKVDWFFKEIPKENVLDVCRKLFQMLKDFVTEAKAF